MIDIKRGIVSYEKEVVTKETCECDICKKIIYEKTFNTTDGLYDYTWHTDGGYEAIRGHHEWGNDSSDSVEILHLCSDNCLGAVVLDYIEKYTRDYKSGYLDLSTLNDYNN